MYVFMSRKHIGTFIDLHRPSQTFREKILFSFFLFEDVRFKGIQLSPNYSDYLGTGKIVRKIGGEGGGGLKRKTRANN